MQDENAGETKVKDAWKKVEETRGQKLAEAKEIYQVVDNVMCIKFVVTNADRIGTKYYIDADSVKEIKEVDGISKYSYFLFWRPMLNLHRKKRSIF